MPLEYTYSFLILLQILPKGHDGESSPACCAPENACHRLRARPAPPPDEVPSRAALLNPPPAPGPPVRCARPPVRCARPLCGAPGPPVRCARPLCGAPGPSVRCAETRRSRLAALRRNEICMRGIPVQNKGGTASFASPLFGGGGAFLFVFAHTAPPQSFFALCAARPSLLGSASTLRPPCADGQASPRVKQRIPPSRPHDAAERTIHRHTQHIHTHPYTATGTHNTSTHTFCFEVKGHERDITATQAARAGRH